MSGSGGTIRGIVFDIGGVLAFDVQESLFSDHESGLIKSYHLEPSQVLSVATELWRKYAYNERTNGHDWRRLESQYWEEFSRRLSLSTPVEDFIHLTVAFIRPVHGMMNILRNLHRQQVDILICSNNTEFWFQRQRAKLGLDRYVSSESVVLSCRVGARKSSPKFEMFKALEPAMKYDPEYYLFVDDRFENIQRAVQFGLTGIQFPTGSASGAEYLQRLLQTLGVPSNL